MVNTYQADCRFDLIRCLTATSSISLVTKYLVDLAGVPETCVCVCMRM